MKIRFLKTIVFISLVLAYMLIVGCSSKLNSYPSLVNQGILPVSPSNSYLGTNLFLGSEASKSDILYHFLASRGSPGAIELVEEAYKPARMYLFYPRQVQVYVAELSTSKKSYDWIIRGPYNIERADFRKLAEVERSFYEASPIIIDGKIFRFAELPTPIPTSTPTSLPTPRVTASPKRPKLVKSTHLEQVEVNPGKTSIAVPTSKPILTIPSGPGLNSDQQAIRLSKGLTELSPEGDIVHKVQNSGESIESIAKWYSGDSAQAKTIAEFNSIPIGAQLPKGSKIKIPKAITKTEQAMH